MAFTQRAIERISESVHYTEGVQRGTKVGVKRRRGGNTQSQTVRKGVVVADINPGETGQISIWRDGVDTGELLDVNTWIDGGEKFSAGKKVVVEYFADEHVWTIMTAECE